MAMTLRLDNPDDHLLAERANAEGRSKQDLAKEAIHLYLTDPTRRVEHLEDQAALAAHDLAKARGEVTYTTQDDLRNQLGMPR